MLGPSSDIKTVSINGDEFTVRKREPTSLFLRGEMAGASCPFLYTRARRDDQWRSDGTILVGDDNRSKKTTDRHMLGRFDGSLFVLERESEVSHIDAMWVDDIAPDGAISELLPEDARLAKVDENEGVLRRGQSITVRFKGFKPAAGHTYVLYSTGYYDPSSKMAAR